MEQIKTPEEIKNWLKDYCEGELPENFVVDEVIGIVKYFTGGRFIQPNKGVEEAAKEWVIENNAMGKNDIWGRPELMQGKAFLSGAFFNQARCDKYRKALEKIKDYSEDGEISGATALRNIERISTDALK